MSYLEDFGKMNDKERSLLVEHWKDAFTVSKLATKAQEETAFRFGRNEDGDSSDAFRHCYWSALLARELGYDIALKFTNAHEDVPNNPSDKKAMDLHNNAVGLEIGTGQYKSDPALAEECKNALIRGKLKTLRF